MEAIVERAAGLDVHQGSVVACVIRGAAGRRASRETRTFGTMRQDLAALREWLLEMGVTLDRVVALHAPDDKLMVRLAGRRQSQATGRIYHLLTNPPPKDDPGPFIQRLDDTPATIRRRLALYHAATEPLQEYYAARGLLVQVDACAPIATVTAAILRAVDGGYLSPPSASPYTPLDAAR